MGQSEGQTQGVVICCPGCRYELTGLPAGVCPECGRGFDPLDPTTVWDVAARKRANRRRRIRIGLMAVACLVVMQLAVFTIIPRPVIGNTGGLQWGLWVWLGKGYGVQREHLNAETLLVHRWGSRVSKIESRERWPSGRPRTRWMLERRGPDAWRFEVLDSTVNMQSVLLAFNTMRTDEEMFGLILADRAREEAGEVFRVEGTSIEVMSAIIRVYGISPRPRLTSESDAMVWVVSPESGELEEVTVSEAEARGIEVEPFWDVATQRIELGR